MRDFEELVQFIERNVTVIVVRLSLQIDREQTEQNTFRMKR